MNGDDAQTSRWIERAVRELEDLGLRRGGIVLVHSSLSQLGHVPGGPATVIAALREAISEAGTLLLPALSYASVGPTQPHFDARHTPCCVGAIPEHFRRSPGVLRSTHPTHSVCGVGPQAHDILHDNHLDDTPCGARSAFRKLRDRGGQVLMLGCGLKPNTSMHAVEELAGVPYPLGEHATYHLIDMLGQRHLMRCRRHAFNRNGMLCYRQRYDRLEQLMSEPYLCRGPVHDAAAWLIDAPAMWDVALRAMYREPYYFVDHVGAV